ncbi:MAG: NADH-quinone oxidoreductase subunit M, partial [Actinomycetota bacterium]
MAWLSWTLWTPLAGAILMAALPKSRPVLARAWALIVSLVAFAFSLGMLAAFHTGEAGMQMVER